MWGLSDGVVAAAVLLDAAGFPEIVEDPVEAVGLTFSVLATSPAVTPVTSISASLIGAAAALATTVLRLVPVRPFGAALPPSAAAPGRFTAEFGQGTLEALSLLIGIRPVA
jgi:hypothetical protein